MDPAVDDYTITVLSWASLELDVAIFEYLEEERSEGRVV